MRTQSARQDTHEWDELMNAAEREFAAGNLDTAKQLYLQVVSGADDSESCDFARDGVSCVRLLTSDEFIHYVHLMKQDGRNEGLEWVPSARATALWRLGYICVEQREFKDGIVYLERAHRVLPRSAKITIELAFCHGVSGNHQIALSLYESIGDVGYHVTARDKAMSLRGAGAQLTELGRFDTARNAYQESLQFETSQLALQEIAYVRHLMVGGSAVPVEPTPAGDESSCCSECGAGFTDGFSGMKDSRVIYLCPKCERRTRRAWWQFWRPRRVPLVKIQFQPDRESLESAGRASTTDPSKAPLPV